MPMIDSILMGSDDNSSTRGGRIPDEVKRQLLAAQLLQKQAADGSTPIYTPTLGWGKVAAAGIGGLMQGITEKKESAEQAKMLADRAEAAFPGAAVAPASNASSGLGGMISALLNGGDKTPDAPQPAAPETKPAAFAPSDYATALAPDASLPRGIRNNNPLNIEAGDYTKSQPGFMGSDGRFAKFETPEQGTAAADKLLQTYATKYGLNTPAGIVGRWAPASDGNNVSAYASNVAKTLGVDPNAPIDMNDPQVRSRLIAAMGQHENGRPIQMASLPQGQGAPPAAPAPQAQPQLAQANIPNDEARRDAALKRIASNPREDPKIQFWALEQLSPAAKLELKTKGVALQEAQGKLGQLPIETKTKEADLKLKERQLEGEGAVALNADERKLYHVPEDLPAYKTRAGEIKFGPAAAKTNINTAPGPAKSVYDTMEARADKARSAATALPAFDNALKAVDGGGIFGQGADIRLGMAKVGALLGVDPSAVQNTETFRSAVAPIVLSTVKGLGAGSGISNADREFAEKAAGGNINLDPGSIRRLLDIGKRAADATISEHNRTVDAVYPTDSPENKQVRALFRVDPSAFAPAAPAQPVAPAPAAAAPAASQPSRQDIEAEMRRRGILK